ncbi:extracellular solute-binding protein [Paenibacillus sp. YYML68]|uniref:extracellular solute-binding protein n=1 Tax=Paenibacillus sp. YYML68 TaxID=2909250 RepID=UPI002490D885|nr:extracellular solute-binding protein [Paenibacillus sp. YYML68]
MVNNKKMAVIAMMAASSMLLAACTENSNDQASELESTQVILSEQGVYPLVQEKVTLKVMVGARDFVENYETNQFTKWYEELTNVHIDWEVVPSKSIPEKLNLMLASGDYPDVVLNMAVSNEQQMVYGKDGVFLPLNGLIEKHAPNVQQRLAELAGMKEVLTAPNGSIYALPQIEQCYHCTLSQKLWIYKPWLDKLKLDMPTTTEAYYEVLKAFKEQDPNGNGLQDEIPLAGSPKGWNTRVNDVLMNAFIPNNTLTSTKHMFLNGGKVEVAFDKPEWKQGLEYLHRMHKEGLLATESFTQDGMQLQQMGEQVGAHLLGSAPGGATGAMSKMFGASGKWMEFAPVPPLKGPRGVQLAAYNPYGGSMFGKFLITKNAKYPEVAMRWVDGFYGKWDDPTEIMMRSLYGVPGRDWVKAEEGMIGIHGQAAKYKVLVPSETTNQNVHWSQTAPTVRSSDFRLSEAIDLATADQNPEVRLYKATKLYEPHQMKVNTILPPLFLTREQSEELAGLQKTILEYVDQMVARFVTGDADLNTEWTPYLDTLKGMKLKRYVEIYQEAYDKR